MKMISLKDCRQILISYFTEISPLGNKLFYADGWMDEQTDGQTDMTKLIVPLGNFVNARN
jgi:hypothetical protein